MCGDWLYFSCSHASSNSSTAYGGDTTYADPSSSTMQLRKHGPEVYFGASRSVQLQIQCQPNPKCSKPGASRAQSYQKATGGPASSCKVELMSSIRRHVKKPCARMSGLVLQGKS